VGQQRSMADISIVPGQFVMENKHNIFQTYNLLEKLGEGARFTEPRRRLRGRVQSRSQRHRGNARR
jgi:hypothetical protein